jgi:hypothetical protein
MYSNNNELDGGKMRLTGRDACATKIDVTWIEAGG